MDGESNRFFRVPPPVGFYVCSFAVLAVLAVYWPCVHFPFVGYDDDPYIILNPLLGRFDFHSLVAIWRNGGCSEENLYIPLTYTTYFLETALFGKTPLVIHLDNLLLHAANTVLLLLVARRLGLGWFASTAAALAFGLHPLQVEPVAWCMGRKDLLASFLGLSAIFAWLGPRGRGETENRRRGEMETGRDGEWESRGECSILHSQCSILNERQAAPSVSRSSGPSVQHSASTDSELRGRSPKSVGVSRLALVVAFGVAAMLAKPVMVVLPAILLAAWWLFMRGGRNRAGRDGGPAAVIALFMAAALIVAVNLAGSFRAPVDASAARLASAAVFAVSEWIKRFLLFGVMRHRYLWPPDSELFSVSNIILPLCAVVSAGLAWKFSKYDKRLLFGFCFFISAFLPPLAHIRYADQFIMADRYSYFPLAGLFLAVFAFQESLQRTTRRLFAIFCVCVSPLVIRANRAALRSWSDSLAFWSFEAETNPADAESAYFAGLARQERGDYAGALRLYERCLKLDPNHIRAVFAAGSVMFYEKRYESALAFYERALKLDSPYKADVLANIAQTYLKLRNVDSAIVFLKKSLAVKNDPANRVWLARALLFKGEMAAARREAAKAVGDGAVPTDDLKQAFPDLR